MTGVQILTVSVVFTSHQVIWECRESIGNYNNRSYVALCLCDSWGFYNFQTDFLSKEKMGEKTPALSSTFLFLMPDCLIEHLSNTSFFTIAEWSWKSFTFPFKNTEKKYAPSNDNTKMYEIIFIHRKKIELF